MPRNNFLRRTQQATGDRKLADLEARQRFDRACTSEHAKLEAIPPERFPHGTREIPMPLARNEAGLRAEDVAQIVHDLRNPLSTIALEACLLDAKLIGVVNADARRAVGRITHNVAFLDRMVNDLLDLCSIDAGRLVIHREPRELRSLLQVVLERVISTRDRGRAILEAPTPVIVAIDELRIERVIANLLQNALKYAPKSEIVLRLDVTGEQASISVCDAGPGMTADEVTYVFDKYRRTAAALAHEGLGLGLYVSKKIVEAHGGRIGVESRHGAGSRFYFELPRFDPAESGA
jgi:signal transduction histidine kinase